MNQQNVLVTAGASGIGYATVKRFLEAGARVAVCDIDQQKLDEVKGLHPQVITALVDVGNSQAIRAFVGDVVENLGGIDVVVNNAGIAGPTAAIEDIADDEWLPSFSVNIHSVFYMLREVVPLMKARGGGAIINISTGSTFTVPLNRSPYIASKWAVEGLTRAAARELGPANIRVNAIRPGIVDGERMRRVLTKIAVAQGTTVEALEAEALGYISMRTKIQPEEIGDMAVFLASAKAAHISGQMISVDGNMEWE
ncbi:SDR family oxidoreductase [Exilibacterium tricleocarpae]|uniref:SDR family oxidoreductase n=1 Tax=Exilibacterium tricleocarpae TaxID=2591008 RepID=A0A545TNB2_9GAMM|nr:SDR family oxidoreductase [Exilibacterium tricleocarpae]TQV78717.1 SDR family oxidoreductase [Exilibacterium tricleocarpae]